MEDIFSLQGKVAIVTGGNGGIGKGIADGFASKGSDIVVAARNETKTAEAVRDIKEKFGVRALGVKVDVSREESVLAAVKQALEEFGQINILVNNAGTNIRKHPEDYSTAEWDVILDTNLRGAFTFSQAVFPAMRKAGGGSIINIGSGTSLFGASYAVPYAASKAGILQTTYSLALAWAKYNIRVNAIVPGWIDTPLTAGARRDLPKANEHVLTRVPLGRWGKPADLAGAAIFLASSAASFVTAEYIKVDGGYLQGIEIM
jgi:2-deoxy-D-gluconate 3-dehydrogenase